ncbi:MAG: dienelactone hydrolase family protein [Acidobacteria bacterium]|nr:dienelactone hydrolase family protein [Acidobacteriota bacterium]
MSARALTFLLTIAVLPVSAAIAIDQPGSPPGTPVAPPAHDSSAMSASIITRAGLPPEQMAKSVLSAALARRHPQYLDLPAGAEKVRSFVVFPERPSKAPVIVITANNQGMTDWMRAVGDDAAAQGFIAVVPDLLTGKGPRASAVTRAAIDMPASNGQGASVQFNFEGTGGRIDVTIQSSPSRTVSFEIGDHAWHKALAYLTQIDSPGAAQQAARGAQAGAPAEATSGMRGKLPHLPANFLMAAKVVAQSPRKGEWVDIPMAGGTKLHTWISYPQTTGKAPVVLVYQPGPGMDMGEPVTRGGGANWLRAIADQLAYEGFIAVLPDLTSGLGPNGGNFDSFQFPDESGAALNRIPHSAVLDRIRVARDYAMKLPMANGRLGATGFCMGGGLAWESAAEIEGVNASVVFYGTPPDEPVMTRIKAPVAAFFGANDLGLAPRIAPATADMKRLGKSFEVEVYPEATHVFLYRQDLGRNMAATQDAWPKAMAFFKRHLMTTGTATR